MAPGSITEIELTREAAAAPVDPQGTVAGLGERQHRVSGDERRDSSIILTRSVSEHRKPGHSPRERPSSETPQVLTVR